MSSQRRYAVALIIFCLFVLCSYRIASLHLTKVDNNQTLKEKGIHQMLGHVVLKGYRGKILDRNGHILAVELPLRDIVIDSTLLQKQLYESLSGAIGLSVEKIKAKIKKSKARKHVTLLKNLELTQEEVQSTNALLKKTFKIDGKDQKMHGVFLTRGAKRYYPEGETTTPLLGLTDYQLNGITGLELAYQELLSAKDGLKQVIFNSRRNLAIADVEVVEAAKQGQDIQLTIDKNMQYFVHRAVKEAVQKHQAKSGAAVLLNNQGELLALSSYPTVDGNDRSDYQAENYRNIAIADVFDVGSTIKPFIAMLALQQNRITVDEKITTIDKDKQQYHFDLAQVLKKSHNLSMMALAKRLKKDDIWHTLNDLGFGHKNDILSGAAKAGRLRHYFSWNDVDKGSISYGYGLDASLLQLAQAYLVLANQGNVMGLSLLKENSATIKQTLFDEEVVDTMRQLLVSVVSDGTAKAAKLDNVSVAGKTGTTRKFINGQYHNNRHRAFFVGLVPAEKPQYVMAVMVDDAKVNGYTGGRAAAPVFKVAMNQILKSNPLH